MQGVDVCLAAFPHGHVLDVEALVAPGAKSLDVELVILGGHVEDRGAVTEGQPAAAGREILERHSQWPGGARSRSVSVFACLGVYEAKRSSMDLRVVVWVLLERVLTEAADGARWKSGGRLHNEGDIWGTAGA